METSLTAATWFWLLVPMLSVLALSIITAFGKRKGD